MMCWSCPCRKAQGPDISLFITPSNQFDILNQPSRWDPLGLLLVASSYAQLSPLFNMFVNPNGF
jgi:hypothetical protein